MRAQAPDGGPDKAQPEGSESHLGRQEEENPEEPVEQGSESHLGREKEVPLAEEGYSSKETSASIKEQIYAAGSPFSFRPRNWLTLTLQHDLVLLGSEDGVCSGSSEAVTCVDANEERIDPTLVTVPAGRFSGGLSSSTTRVLLGYERVFNDGFAVGVRAGLVLLGAPDAPGSSEWLRLHLEARVSYFLGGVSSHAKTLRPFVAVGGGFARLSASSSTTIGLGGTSVSADAYRTAGPGFVFIGAGSQVALSRYHALRFEVRGALHGGDSGVSLSGGLGYDIGF